MIRTFPKHWLLASSLAAFTVFSLVGCGGGADDPTNVALKPNKEAAKEGATNGKNGGETPAATNGGGEQASQAGYGGITGQIVIADGDPIPEPGIRIAKGAASVNPEFCAANAVIPDDSLVVNPQNRGVAHVFIYLARNPARGKKEAAHEANREAVFDQKDCVFLPHSMVMRTDQEIIVKSQDPVPHNVHTNPTRSDSFNKVIDPTNKEGIPMTYQKPETVPCSVTCDFHKWMKAYHLPLDHPYAVATDADGKFTMADLPSGTHEFVIWHERPGYLERKFKVTVKADETTDLGKIPFGTNRLTSNEFRGPKPKVVKLSLVGR